MDPATALEQHVSIIRHALEVSLERRVVDAAALDFGLRSLKLNLRYDAGWPDRLWLLPGGRPLFSEFKRPGDDPKPLQAERLRFLRELGYNTAVFDDYDIAMRRLRG
jgi:hypothetical protein